MVNTVVSKIRVKNPNKHNTKFSNAEYCKYIATRSGVWTDKDTLSMSENESYAAYISKRPNSHGLFGNIDVDHLTKVCNYIKHKSEDKTLIYRGILSLSKEDAINLGYCSQLKWRTLLDTTMSSIASEFNIPIQNLEWVGAFHYEKGHPHVHYMFWNKEQQIASPYIHVTKQQRCREIFSKEIYKEERSLFIQEKTATRDLILELGKDIMSQSETLIQDLFQLELKKEKIPNKIYPNEINDLSKKLIKLANSLPNQGKMAYTYMPIDIKEQICAITDSFFNRVDMRKELLNYLVATENISRSYSTLQLKQYIQKSNAYKDIQKRLGNIILRSAVQIKSYKNINLDYFNEVNYHEQNSNNNSQSSDFYKFNITNDLHNMIDFEKSVEQFEKSCDQENQSASYSDKFYLNKENMHVNLEKSISYLELSAAQKNQFAQYSLGKIYLDKESSCFNLKKAISYLELSAAQKNQFAQYSLGRIYLDKEFGCFDLKKAISYLELSAAQKNQFAQYSLGRIYLDKEFGCFDLKKAISYLELSAAQKNQFAQYSLGKLYADKKSDIYNLKKSLFYLKSYAKQENKYTTKMIQHDIEMKKNFIQHQSFKLFLNIFDSLVSYNNEETYEKETNFVSKQAIKEYLKSQGVNLQKD